VHPEVDPARIVLVGHSLGGWAAILASRDDHRIKGVAVYGCVTDTRTLRFSLSEIKAEFTPWLQGISPHGFSRLWADLGPELIPVEQVAHLAPRPLMVIHGKEDDVVPISQSQALIARAGEPKTFFVHPTAGHGFIWDRPWLIDRILTWLNETGI